MTVLGSRPTQHGWVHHSTVNHACWLEAELSMFHCLQCIAAFHNPTGVIREVTASKHAIAFHNPTGVIWEVTASKHAIA